MKTRDQLYSIEAAGLLRAITMYHSLTEEQARRLYPGKSDKIANLLTHLARQGRIYHDRERGRYSADAETAAHSDPGMAAAVWVLLDFIDRVEYHSASDFPVKISFFADGEVYEIVYVPYEQEMLINHAAAELGDDARRIVLVDQPEQISQINIPGTSGYCTVTPEGKVTYFKLE